MNELTWYDCIKGGSIAVVSITCVGLLLMQCSKKEHKTSITAVETVNIPTPKPEVLELAPESVDETDHYYTEADLKTMRGIVTGVRNLHKTCSIPRDRGPTQVCMNTLRKSHAKVNQFLDQLDNIPKDAPGHQDLYMATSLSKECCNCLEKYAKLCEDVRNYLHAAATELKQSHKPVEDAETRKTLKMLKDASDSKETTQVN